VIKELSYKPEDCGFEIRLGERIFSKYLILPAALGPEAFSLSHLLPRNIIFLFLVLISVRD
jgi:hypothetical protein